MFWFYVAALIVGGVFIVPLFIGGLGDLDADADLDLDADVDGDFGGEGDSDALGVLGDIGSGLFSVRSLAFFATFFGLTGVILELLSYNSGLTLGVSIGMGLTAALLNSMAFTLIKRGEASSQVMSSDLEGRAGTVAVPIEPGRRGRVRVDLGGQPQYLAAVAMDPNSTLERGHPIVVVRISGPTATVASMRDMGLPEDDDRPQLES